MPRNSGTGVYSPPPNITATPLSTIESGDWNALVNDVTATFNVVLPPNLGGTGQTSLSSLLSAIGGMPVAGGSFTGPVAMSGDATAALQPVTKQQFDTGLATKAASTHTHVVANITDFSSSVTSAIAATSVNALSDVAVSGMLSGHILRWNGTNFVNTLPYVEFNAGTLSAIGLGVSKATIAHGLGVRPYNCVAFYRCKNAELGFAVGDEIQTLTYVGASTTEGVHLVWNATNIYVSADGPFYVYTLPGSGTAIDQNNYDLIIRAFR